MMKKIIITFLVIAFSVPHAMALTSHEIAMFKKLERKWTMRERVLMKQRSRIKGSDPRYTELTKKIIKAAYWQKYYRDAQVDKSTTWHIIKNTVVWSAQDLVEMGSIMWNESENLMEKLYTGNWTDLLKDAAESLMKQKVRKMVRERFGKSYPDMEQYIYTQFIAPKVDKSKLHQYAEDSFNKAKDRLKDAYVEEVKRQAKSRSKEELERYGKNIAKRVAGAVDAAEFSIDMVQKYVMWNDAQAAISNMLSHIKRIQKRESCSVVKAFNIYKGKEKMTAVQPAGGSGAFNPDKPPRYYIDPARLSTRAYTMNTLIGKIRKPANVTRHEYFGGDPYYYKDSAGQSVLYIKTKNSKVVEARGLNAPFERNRIFKYSTYTFYPSGMIRYADHNDYKRYWQFMKKYRANGIISEYKIARYPNGCKGMNDSYSMVHGVIFQFDARGRIVAEKLYHGKHHRVTVTFNRKSGKPEKVIVHEEGSMPVFTFPAQYK